MLLVTILSWCITELCKIIFTVDFKLMLISLNSFLVFAFQNVSNQNQAIFVANFTLAKVGIRFSLLYFYICLFVRVSFHRYCRFTEQQGNGRDHILNHSATSISSRTFIHLFASFHMRYLSRIFNRTVCIDQTATR